MNKLKLSVFALITAVMLPVSASALTFFPRSLDPGNTFLTSSNPSDGIDDGIFGRDFGATGVPTSQSYVFTVLNDLAVGQTIEIALLGITALDNFRFTLDGFFIDATNQATATLAAGQSANLTIAFDNPTGSTEGRFVTSLAAVPLPAGLILMLTALGGLFITRRRRKSDFAAA